MPPPDRWGRVILRIDAPLARVENTFALIAALTIGFLMFLGAAQVALRKIVQAPIFGYIDIVELAMGVFAFMAAAYCQRLGGHIRMDLVITRLAPRPRWILETFGCLVGVGVITILAWFAWGHMARAFTFGDSTIDVSLPLWPSKLLVPVAFAPLIARLALQAAAYARLAVYPDAEPIGAPRTLSVQETAEQEIRDANPVNNPNPSAPAPNREPH